MKTAELIRLLEKEGFQRTNKGKKVKHLKYKHPDGRSTMVSKGNYEIPRSTLRKIEKQTDLQLI